MPQPLKLVSPTPAPDLTGPQRPFLFDAEAPDIEPHRYLEPEVNRLKEWAMRANLEIAEETAMSAHSNTLPTGVAIGLMATVSVAIWVAVASIAMLVF